MLARSMKDKHPLIGRIYMNSRRVIQIEDVTITFRGETIVWKPLLLLGNETMLKTSTVQELIESNYMRVKKCEVNKLLIMGRLTDSLPWKRN
jgi:hypothetical protein